MSPATLRRGRPTWQWMVIGFCALCLSPLVFLAVIVALSPWGLGTLGVVLVIYLVIEFARRRGTPPDGQPEEEPHVDTDTPHQQQ